MAILLLTSLFYNSILKLTLISNFILEAGSSPQFTHYSAFRTKRTDDIYWPLLRQHYDHSLKGGVWYA